MVPHMTCSICNQSASEILLPIKACGHFVHEGCLIPYAPDTCPSCHATISYIGNMALAQLQGDLVKLIKEKNLQGISYVFSRLDRFKDNIAKTYIEALQLAQHAFQGDLLKHLLSKSILKLIRENSTLIPPSLIASTLTNLTRHSLSLLKMNLLEAYPDYFMLEGRIDSLFREVCTKNTLSTAEALLRLQPPLRPSQNVIEEELVKAC